MHHKHFEPVIVDNLASAVTYHESVIDFATLCGYEANLNGICYGVGVMASQAQLSGPGEFTRFNRRLALMPAIACLIEEDLIKQWYIVCENPEKYITEKNIVKQKKRILANHNTEWELFKSKSEDRDYFFHTFMNTLSDELQTGIAEQALYTATIQSATIRETIFRSVPHDEKICEETAQKIRKRIEVRIEIISEKINGIATNEQVAKRDKKTQEKIFDQWRLQNDALNDLKTLEDNEIIDLIRETPAFLEAAYAYASSDSYAANLKKDVLAEAGKNSKVTLDELILKAINNVNTSRQSWELVQYYHASDAVMTKGGMRKGFKYIDKFTNEKLTDFFDEYKKVLGDSAGLCAFNMAATSHAISGGFDSMRGGSGQYWLIDANQLPVKYFDTADTFAAAIMGCFRSNIHLKDSFLLTIEAVHLNEENENIDFTEKLNQFKSGFLQNLKEQRQAYLKQNGYDYCKVKLLISIAKEIYKNSKFDDIETEVVRMLKKYYRLDKEDDAIKVAIWVKVKFGDEIIKLSKDFILLYKESNLIISDIGRHDKDEKSISGGEVTIKFNEFCDTRSLLSGIVSSWKIEENFFIYVRERLESVMAYDTVGEKALLVLSDAY